MKQLCGCITLFKKQQILNLKKCTLKEVYSIVNQITDIKDIKSKY